MSLLQNQDFIIYRIRSRYLHCMKDGVGERLITLNPTALNVPAFKNAGWGVGQDIKRTYSPPIPSGTTGEYFTRATPGRSIVEETVAPSPASGLGGDEANTLLGSRFSQDSGEASGAKTPRVDASRQRRMQREEEDSSDESNDSEDDESTRESMDRPAQRIQFDFTKKELPVRPRAGSSPIRNGPTVLITSPSVKIRTGRRLRGGSHGDVDFKTQEPLETESVPGADEELLSSGIIAEQEKIHAEIVSKLRASPNSSLPRDQSFDSGDESDASSTMSSDFIATADSQTNVIGNSLSPPLRMVMRTSPATLHALPPPIRPISQIQPISALTQLLKAKASEAEHPLEAYRLFSGKGELTPVYLKIYIPFCRDSSPFEVIVNRVTKEEDGRSRETTVAEAIGFTLYRYIEEKKDPPLDPEQCNINRWTFRMVDDGEPDDDFPPLERTQPVTSYMTKKAPRGRGAATRDLKIEGEFALVEATEDQYIENCRQTPVPTRPRKSSLAAPSSIPALSTTATPSLSSPTPFTPTPTHPLRAGPSKILRIHVSSIDPFTQSISICVTTDTPISEVLSLACRKKGLSPSRYELRVSGQPAATHLAVASLSDLDLVHKASYLKFTVFRKASMSFMSRHERVLAIDAEYIHIMPSDRGGGGTRSIHISTIIGCKTYRKAPSSFKILVMRPQKETKRYDFEAVSEEQAREVVEAVMRAVGEFAVAGDR